MEYFDTETLEKTNRELEPTMDIYNAGNRIMNTYIYDTQEGYVMVDTGYEHSLGNVEKKLRK